MKLEKKNNKLNPKKAEETTRIKAEINEIENGNSVNPKAGSLKTSINFMSQVN